MQVIPRYALPRTRLVVAKLMVTFARALAGTEPAEESELASCLTNEVVALSEVGGRAEEALASIQEAVTIRRRLAGEHPARYEPELALCLTNEAVALRGVGGRAEEALASIREAVAIYRRLAGQHPARYEPEFAFCLTNEAAALSEVGGRAEEALASIQEAVTISRLLAARDPERWRRICRRRLAVLRGQLEDLGRADESLREGMRGC